MSAAPKGSSRLLRIIKRAPLVLSKHVWIWPLIGALLISLVGLWTRNLVEGGMNTELVSRLQTLLSANVAALRLWFAEKEADARSFAADVRIQEAIVQLRALALDPNVTRESLVNSPPSQTLQLYLRPILEAQRYLDYVVIAPDRRIIASQNEYEVNRTVPPGYDSFVRRALNGQALVSRPFSMPDPRTGQPNPPAMFAVAPVLAAHGEVIAVLGLRLDPEQDFSSIFAVARIGDTGEAYAFDGRGMMLTRPRFQEDLKALGLISNTPNATAILHLKLLDPGIDLQKGKPNIPRERMPLTRMAASATTEWDGYDAQGYRNYRGVKVIGAWAWLPEYGMGVATEVSTEEAFQTLYIVRRVFFTLFLLLVLSGVAIFVFSLLVERLEASVRRGVVDARRVGQYVLVQEIGRGATGMVYRARHMLLRRPVAIKLLSPDLTNSVTAESFEHEVQMTSQLTHPNTVAIYDYGRTPEGLFYYAMEYLRGITLDRLVREFGPQSPGRIIHILRQMCGSIAEAHHIGLIHRDIKPANVVLTRRAGACDVVKVLDFGLVKAVNLSLKGVASTAVVGTPHFMSPEAISNPENVDGRSDLYSLGAVGYWLLTGKTLFASQNVDRLLEKQVNEQPAPPSQIMNTDGAADLAEIISKCLSKNPDDRIQSAEALDARLAGCAAAFAWTTVQAEEWWRAHLGGIETIPAATMPEKTLVIQRKG
jgi:tRNA A-37 threonylcarbamoyl transferase component Bud32